MESVKYKYSKAYYKILELIENNPNEDVFVICGGQGASKTISIIELIIQSLCSSSKEATVLSSELSKMKKTVIRDYNKICKDWDIFNVSNDFNKSESKHEYNNGSYIDFLGADVADVGKGFRRDLLYINEADKLEVDSATQFISRAGLTIIDYNPDKAFWGDDYVNENNFLRLTYLDNEFLSESEVKSIIGYKEKGFHNPNVSQDRLFDESNIKNKYWANKWKVYGLGLVGTLEGAVYDNWSYGEFNNNLPTLFGIDFGSNDPNACVELAVDIPNKIIYLKLAVYRNNIGTKTLFDLLLPQTGHDSLIIGDSANRQTIYDLSEMGLNIQGVKKGNVVDEIRLLQNFRLIVEPNSHKIGEALTNYVWIDERAGLTDRKWKHIPDAFRYGAMYLIKYSGNEIF